MTRSDSADVAAWAAERGWAVAPGIPGKKAAYEQWAPRHKKWGTEGYLTPADVRRKWPTGRHSVLILTGPSGLVCDDLDVDEDGDPAGAWELETLAAEGEKHRALPMTFTMATPSGGLHLVWSANGHREYKTCSGQVAPHIDVRGRGGLFVLWDPDKPRAIIDGRDPVPIPKWLSRLHPEPGAGSDLRADVPDARAWVRKYGKGEPCEWRDKLLDEAEELYRDGEVPHEVLTKYTLSLVGDTVVGHPGLEVALNELEVMHRDAMAGKSREREWRVEFWGAVAGAIARKFLRGRVYGEDPCNDNGDFSEAGASVKQQKQNRLLATIKTGAWLSQQKFKPLQFAVPKILPEGYTVLAGAPFTGKSVLMTRLGIEVARGGYVFGMKVRRRHVYYLALETSEPRLQEQCFELLGDDDEIPEWFNFENVVPPKQLVPKVDAYLDTYPGSLVMIDTLSRVMEAPVKGESTYDRDYRIGSYLKNLEMRYSGATILASRHTKKGKTDDWLELVSGTNAVTGAADTVYVLDRTRNTQDGMLQIASRVMDEARYSLTIERPYGWMLEGSDLDESANNAHKRQTKGKLGDHSVEVIDFIESNPNGVDRQAVAKELGISESDAGVYLKRATDAGHIVRIKRGVYGPVGKSRVGADDDDN